METTNILLEGWTKIQSISFNFTGNWMATIPTLWWLQEIQTRCYGFVK